MIKYSIEDLSPVSYMLVKLAARCNINCTYCYWFRDEEVYKKPNTLTLEAEKAWLAKLEKHILNYELKTFSLLFHGGEPMLFGLKRFNDLLEKLELIESNTNCNFKLAITTNGILMNDEWALTFKKYQVAVTVSLDGAKGTNDKRRVDFKNKGTFDSVLEGITYLDKHAVNYGLLAVCDPMSDPIETTKFFVEDLNQKEFDILFPDATNEDNPISVGDFYVKLFDFAYSDYYPFPVKIRLFDSILKGILGLDSNSESIGPGPISTMTLMTNGDLEPLDIMRIREGKTYRSETNIFDHDIEDIKKEKEWIELFNESTNYAQECESCDIFHICGGGHVASRWSKTNGLKNPSSYCGDYKEIIGHIYSNVVEKIEIEQAT